VLLSERGCYLSERGCYLVRGARPHVALFVSQARLARVFALRMLMSMLMLRECLAP